MSASYYIPAATQQNTLNVSNSRFITTCGFAETVDQAKQFISQIRSAFSDANHHVYAFRIGHGKSVIDGMSDDGEPAGTAGPPTLAVLRGSDVGDIVLVTTRYFGGTKLGKGGLVRAYTDAARAALAALQTELKIEKKIVSIEIEYRFYEQVKRALLHYAGVITDERFETTVTIIAVLPAGAVSDFGLLLTDLTTGQAVPIVLGDA